MEPAPLVSPRRILGPDRLWSEEDWDVIRAGSVPRDQEDRWWAYVEDDVLHLHRSGTGFEVYRARFVRNERGGVRVPEIEVETDVERYEPQSDIEEARLFAELVDLLSTGSLTSDGPTFTVVLRRWKARPDGDDRRRSAVVVAEAVLALGPEVVMSHRREFLSIAIWKYTAADGKSTTQHRSMGAVGAPPKLCNHEHVVTRKSLIEKMLADPSRCGEIMSTALGCCVLRAEHQQLVAVERADPSLEGWDRYRAAGIAVVDLLTGERVT